MKKFLLILAALLALAAPRAEAVRVVTYKLYAPDSVAAGTTIATEGVPCFGADMVVFQWGNRDSVKADTSFSSFYVDSFSSGGIQFSNDGANYSGGMTATNTTVGAKIYGATTPNITSRIDSTASPGGRLTTVFGYNGDASGLSSVVPISVRFLRWTGVVHTRPRCGGNPGCAGNAAMYRPFVRAFVYFRDNAVDQPTQPRNDRSIP